MVCSRGTDSLAEVSGRAQESRLGGSDILWVVFVHGPECLLACFDNPLKELVYDPVPQRVMAGSLEVEFGHGQVL